MKSLQELKEERWHLLKRYIETDWQEMNGPELVDVNPKDFITKSIEMGVELGEKNSQWAALNKKDFIAGLQRAKELVPPRRYEHGDCESDADRQEARNDTIDDMNRILDKEIAHITTHKEEKITSVNGGTCNKCGAQNIKIAGVPVEEMHKCPPIKSKEI